MLGGMYRASFRPLNDAIATGRIRGVAADVGCNNPGVTQDKVAHGRHHRAAEERRPGGQHRLRRDRGGQVRLPAAARRGWTRSGPGLREVCEAIGIPPVLHLGSCVDNSRILTVLTQMATEGGLGDDISDIPAVGLAPEWMSEKALAIAAYCAGSGAYVMMGVRNPVEFSDGVTDILSKEWEERFGGKLEFVAEAGRDRAPDAGAHRQEARGAQAARLRSDPLRRVAATRRSRVPEQPVEQQMAELYG